MKDPYLSPTQDPVGESLRNMGFMFYAFFWSIWQVVVLVGWLFYAGWLLLRWMAEVTINWTTSIYWRVK